MTGDAAQRDLFVSVIIPTWNEVAALREAVESARDPSAEVLVVDGGSSDGTVELASRLDVRLVRSMRGRGVQLGAGARAAAGEVLLFLHADGVLPRGYVDDVRRALSDPECVLGAFRLSIDAEGRAFRMIERGANLRSRWLRMPYGDQGLFVRASAYGATGGFAELVAMEDIDLVRRVRRLGKVCTMESHVRASARSWLRHGILRFTLCNLISATGFMLGVPPARIANWRSRTLGGGLDKSPVRSEVDCETGTAGLEWVDDLHPVRRPASSSEHLAPAPSSGSQQQVQAASRRSASSGPAAGPEPGRTVSQG